MGVKVHVAAVAMETTPKIPDMETEMLTTWRR
jgi:hypothetical protein